MYIFMEYCDEGTLEEVSRLGLQEHVIRLYSKQITTAINVLHEHGIVHRDIKGLPLTPPPPPPASCTSPTWHQFKVFMVSPPPPSGANIFLTSSGLIKLGDFGCSVKLRNNTHTMPGEVNSTLGTAGRTSPQPRLTFHSLGPASPPATRRFRWRRNPCFCAPSIHGARSHHQSEGGGARQSSRHLELGLRPHRDGDRKGEPAAVVSSRLTFGPN